MLGKIEGRRRRGQQQMWWLDDIINKMDMSLSMKEETEQALSCKQASILGQTVDFELYAQYLWK